MKRIKNVVKKVRRTIEEDQVVGTKIVDEAVSEFDNFLGKHMRFMCLNFTYGGKLIGANSVFLELENLWYIYNTDEQDRPNDKMRSRSKISRIRLNMVECYSEDDELK